MKYRVGAEPGQKSSSKNSKRSEQIRVKLVIHQLTGFEGRSRHVDSVQMKTLKFATEIY